MSKRATFSPWHPGLWSSLFIITLSGLVTNHYWQLWAIEYRAQVALELRRYSNTADYILYHATRRWLPWPWKSPETTLRGNIVQIERSIRFKYDEFEASELSDVSWKNFKRMVSQWDARNKICRIAMQLNLDSDTCQGSERLPKAWIAYFERTFSPFYFISYVDDRPVFGNRESEDIQYWNTSPIASNFTVLQQLASPELSEFYRVVMQRSQYPLEKTDIETLAPGECRQLRVTSYDMPVEVAFHVAPQNPEMEAWFFGVWKKYHATWLNNPEQFENLVNQTRQNIATTLCDNFQESDDNDINVERLGEKNCESGALQTYLYGQPLSLPRRILFASNYPGFSDYSQYLSDEGALKYDALDSILQEARELAPTVEQQFWLAQKWNTEIQRFEVGASLNDVSGPLVLGVEASQIPQTTILDDAIHIPEEGNIYEINGHSIYSVPDIHEALTKHGDKEGIMTPIYVNIYNEHSEVKDASYTTRFRFNPLALQHFDTNVSALEIGTYGLLFKSTSLSCFFKDIFTVLEYESVERCEWVDQQRYAYAKQMDPEKFDSSIIFGNIVGAIVVPGGIFKGFKLLNGGRRMSTLGKVMVLGPADALTMGAYARAEGAPSETPEERSARGFEAAKEGFLYGSAFALIR